MIGVLRRTVVSVCCFDNLCGSHLQSQVIVLVENSKTLVSDLIGQIKSNSKTLVSDFMGQIKSNSKFKNPGERFYWSNQI